MLSEKRLLKEEKVFRTMDPNNFCHKLRKFLCESLRFFFLGPPVAITTKNNQGVEGPTSLGKVTGIFALNRE